MLRYIWQEQLLSQRTRVVLHYLVRHQKEALFLDVLSKVKQHFGSQFDSHLWITRQGPSTNNPLLIFDDVLWIHKCNASSEDDAGQSWKWWDSFSNLALDHFDTDDKRRKSLVYICGPRGLTNRLIDMYKEVGMDTINGHVQVEKWW